MKKQQSITRYGGADLARVNAPGGQGLGVALGIRITAVGPGLVCGEMPVDGRTRQPYGLLHGGASVSLAETLGSIGSHFLVRQEGRRAVGVEINANHVGAAREGMVFGEARPLHAGRGLHVWQIHIRDANQRLISTSRLTTYILDPDGD